VVIPLSAIFISERREGTMQRLKSQRVSFVMILAGKLLPFCLVNQIQAVLMVLVGIYLVPLAGGEALALPDSWLALWLISLAVSFAAVGWALLVATATRTSEQATVIGGVGNILMGAVGGIMVPKMVMPSAMQPFTALSPMAWALEGFHNVMLRGAGIGGIAAPAAALVGFAVLTLAAALLIYWRRAMP
jgi:ABC-2 type transport system permease protein